MSPLHLPASRLCCRQEVRAARSAAAVRAIIFDAMQAADADAGSFKANCGAYSVMSPDDRSATNSMSPCACTRGGDGDGVHEA